VSWKRAAMPFLEQQHIVVDPGERLLAADVFGQVALVKLRPVAGWDIGRNSKQQAAKSRGYGMPF
jgi:hypothetical protein